MGPAGQVDCGEEHPDDEEAERKKPECHGDQQEGEEDWEPWWLATLRALERVRKTV